MAPGGQALFQVTWSAGLSRSPFEGHFHILGFPDASLTLAQTVIMLGETASELYSSAHLMGEPSLNPSSSGKQLSLANLSSCSSCVFYLG